MLGTNFGLLLSQNQGAEFQLVCESLIASGALVTLYQLGSDDALFAGFGSTVAHSLDHGCSWAPSSGLGSQLTVDFFPSPALPAHVFALGVAAAIGGPSELFFSSDEGTTFAATFAEDAGQLTGVEVAASDAQTVYLAGTHLPADGGTSIPYLLDSSDEGQSWTRHDYPALGPVLLGIAQVDPADPATLYVRSGITTGHDSLQISHDRGATLTDALDLGEAMSGFALAADGTRYVGSEEGHLWVEAPGAASFTQVTSPHVHCLGARGTTLYVCGDQTLDGFVLATSVDQGGSFQKLLSFSQIASLATCSPVQSACQGEWKVLQETFGTGSSSSGSSGHGCGCQSEGPLAALPLLAGGMAKRRRRRGAV